MDRLLEVDNFLKVLTIVISILIALSPFISRLYLFKDNRKMTVLLDSMGYIFIILCIYVFSFIIYLYSIYLHNRDGVQLKLILYGVFLSMLAYCFIFSVRCIKQRSYKFEILSFYKNKEYKKRILLHKHNKFFKTISLEEFKNSLNFKQKFPHKYKYIRIESLDEFEVTPHTINIQYDYKVSNLCMPFLFSLLICFIPVPTAIIIKKFISQTYRFYVFESINAIFIFIIIYLFIIRIGNNNKKIREDVSNLLNKELEKDMDKYENE